MQSPPTQEQQVPSEGPATIPYFAAPPADVFATDAALRAMAKTRPWAILCAIGMFIYALVGGFLGTMWLLVAIFRGGQPEVGLTEFVIVIPPNLIGAPLALAGGLLAVRYHAAVGRTLARRNTEDLERALTLQLYIWRWAALAVLALFALPPIILVLGLLVGVWR